MSFEILFMLVLMGAALVAFVKEIFPIEVTALALVAALVVSGILSAEEAVAGFANKATVTIAGLFVLSHGLMKTGLLEIAAERLGERSLKRPWLGIAALLAGVGAARRVGGRWHIEPAEAIDGLQQSVFPVVLCGWSEEFGLYGLRLFPAADSDTDESHWLVGQVAVTQQPPSRAGSVTRTYFAVSAAAFSAIRSCGRFGPEMHGSTSARSSEIVAE